MPIARTDDGVELYSFHTPRLAAGQLFLKARGPYPAPSGWLWLIANPPIPVLQAFFP